MIEDSLLLERIKKKITNNYSKVSNIEEAKRYYKNKNNILDIGVVPKNEGKDPLRNADNRIPHNIHQLLVDEKIAYLFTYPPIIDVDNNDETNNKVNDVLGEEFNRKIKNIGIEASNAGSSWIHYWYDEAEKPIKFKYELVNAEEIIAIYDNGLERKLSNIIRYYKVYEEVEGQLDEEAYVYIEYWDDKKMIRWKIKDSYTNTPVEEPEIMDHTLEAIPFIEFANNKEKQNDLAKIKRLLDLKDKVVSGFANDIEDIQQIIYILENYGGADLSEFLSDLKRYKTVKTESDSSGGSGGLSTMQIDIPVEARNILLEYLKEEIYESGQGLQQNIESFGNASGTALRFFYRKLELKAGLLETEFRTSINELVKAILKFLNITDYKKINQTYTRNMISNDLENAQIAQYSKGIIPDKIIIRNHPWVDDVEEAELLMKEQEESLFDEYNITNNVGDNNGKE